MSLIKALISDADGTLVNTKYLIRHGQYEATVQYLLDLGVSRVDIPTYEIYQSFVDKSVGGKTRDTFEKTLHLLFSQTHEHILKQIDFDILDASLESVQDRIAPLYVHPFHGLTELFDWTGKSHIKFGIFTSGNRRMIIRNFGVSLPVMGYTELFKQNEIGISERFEAFINRAKAVYGMPELAIVTCEDVTATKPDPEGILKLLEQLELGLEEVIVLGDHPVDMQAAKAAGVHAIGISHGFGTPPELKECGAIRIVDDLATIPRLIELHNCGKELLF